MYIFEYEFSLVASVARRIVLAVVDFTDAVSAGPFISLRRRQVPVASLDTDLVGNNVAVSTLVNVPVCSLTPFLSAQVSQASFQSLALVFLPSISCIVLGREIGYPSLRPWVHGFLKRWSTEEDRSIVRQ